MSLAPIPFLAAFRVALLVGAFLRRFALPLWLCFRLRSSSSFRLSTTANLTRRALSRPRLCRRRLPGRIVFFFGNVEVVRGQRIEKSQPPRVHSSSPFGERETRPRLVPKYSVVALLAPSALGAVRVLPLVGLVAAAEEGRVELRLHALKAWYH